MAQFDPLKKPMSLSESEELLKGAADQEHAKDSWYTVGMFLLVIVCVGAVIAALVWGFTAATMSTALVAFLLLIPFFLNKK
jgi:hypothetical protein